MKIKIGRLYIEFNLSLTSPSTVIKQRVLAVLNGPAPTTTNPYPHSGYIAAIKEYRVLTGSYLKDSKEYVDKLRGQ